MSDIGFALLAASLFIAIYVGLKIRRRSAEKKNKKPVA
jgi:hypothetical protein